MQFRDIGDIVIIFIMKCDISEREKTLSCSVIFMGGSPGGLSEELVTWEKRKKGWRMNCDVGEATRVGE